MNLSSYALLEKQCRFFHKKAGLEQKAMKLVYKTALAAKVANFC
jgi:hypothetical protein